MALLPIQYREFWDVPRSFIVSYEGDQYFFDCVFDDGVEEYPDTYRVYLMPELSEKALSGSWSSLPGKATSFLGLVPVSSVHFDPSKRMQVDSTIFKEIIEHSEHQVA